MPASAGVTFQANVASKATRVLSRAERRFPGLRAIYRLRHPGNTVSLACCT